MRKFLARLILLFVRFVLLFRYRFKVVGLEKLNENTLNRKGGVLFLPNHPAMFVDPSFVTLAVWNKYPLRPIIIEYMYYTPIVHSIMKFMNAIPIPNFDISTNSLKRKRSERALNEVVKGLQKGENFLIYPGGGLKSSAHEVIGGASGVHQIISEAKDANIVLVRVKGLWGSSFSRALTGKSPPMFATIWRGFKFALKNLIFFSPKREVIIELQPASEDFPRESSRLELNRYLENWYNRPDGLSQPTSDYPGDSLVLVSYSMWKEQYLPIKTEKVMQPQEVDLDDVPEEIQEKVIYKLSKMTELSPNKISPEQDLSTDLGLDSLDVAELGVFLEDNFDTRNIPMKEMTTVSKVIGIASKKVTFETEEEEEAEIQGWFAEAPHERLNIAEGDTIAEVFLNNCARFKKQIAIGDLRSGIMTYSKLKMRAIILAYYIQTLPGKEVGILLPSSVAASLCVLACYLAGKVPVMINWTVGSKHLEQVMNLSKVKKVLTSWSFIDRLPNVDLTTIDENLIMLEDVRRELPWTLKLKGFLRSLQGTKGLMRHFKIHKKNPEDRAVLLFTSGTESMPKGVPLSHKNILSNQRSSAEAFPFHADDILLSMLPPFHSFGFTVTTLLPLLSGIKVAHSPDPTDGKKLAHSLEKWGATLTCGAPSFLKNMLKAASPDQVKSLRYILSGAEKAPDELYKLAEKLGLKGKLLQGYGITECSPVLTLNRPDGPMSGVGSPIKDVEILIVHQESQKPLPKGERGLVLVRGPNIFEGYINPDVQDPFFSVNEKEWYSTGDLGYIDEHGNLVISGRLKRFVKIGAEMISLGLIEDALYEAAEKKGWKLSDEGPSIAVSAQENGNGKAKFYVFTTFSAKLEELNQALREEGISNLVKISEVNQISEMPLMGTGKVNYRKLEQEYTK
ncbi:MAG: hypothetical protein Tsb0021_05460 [Chlamydiales bacterium]